jgi:hypothetical protein
VNRRGLFGAIPVAIAASLPAEAKVEELGPPYDTFERKMRTAMYLHRRIPSLPITLDSETGDVTIYPSKEEEAMLRKRGLVNENGKIKNLARKNGKFSG